MKITEDLKHEHVTVLVALKILDQVVASIPTKSEPSLTDLGQLLDFFTGFVDNCHHGKEEDVLFPELERRGVKREGGPIGVMLAEHAAGREHVRALADGLARARRGDAGAVDAIAEQAHAYHQLLLSHIHKENSVLFPMADQVVPEDVVAQLHEQFEKIEQERVGEGKHEAYHALLHGLKTSYGV